MAVEDEEATLSLPSIAIVAVVGFIIYRYFFAASSSSSSGSASSSRNGFAFTQSQVDQVAQMFPQLSRRDIMWDLQRNRGNVQATTERVLTGRGLEQAPPSFQPPMPENPIASTTSASSSRASKPQHPDLIARYNLQSKIDDKGKGKEVEEPSGWASTKEQRQSILQRRRDEMILAARRKMQEKDAQSLPTPRS